MGIFDRAAEEPGAGIVAVQKFQHLADRPGRAGVLCGDLGGHGRLTVISPCGPGHVGALMLGMKDLVQTELFQVLNVEVAPVFPIAIRSPEVGPPVLGGLVVPHVPRARVAETVAGRLERLPERRHGLGQRRPVGKRPGRCLPGMPGAVHHQPMLMRVATGEH